MPPSGSWPKISQRVNSAQTALTVALMLGCLAASCAGARPNGISPSNPNLISPGELDRAREDGIRDLHELIERTRPRWLQTRSVRSFELPTVIAVYHHEARLGGIDVLRGYPLISVTSVRYLDAAQAMMLPGASAHIEGAIVISTALVRDSGPAR
jgi:hypothetical protein